MYAVPPTPHSEPLGRNGFWFYVRGLLITIQSGGLTLLAGAVLLRQFYDGDVRLVDQGFFGDFQMILLLGVLPGLMIGGVQRWAVAKQCDAPWSWMSASVVGWSSTMVCLLLVSGLHLTENEGNQLVLLSYAGSGAVAGYWQARLLRRRDRGAWGWIAVSSVGYVFAGLLAVGLYAFVLYPAEPLH